MLDSNWITLEDAVVLTGYTDGYLRRMLRNGDLKGSKLKERMWLVDKGAAECLAKKPHINGRPRAKQPQILGKKAKSKKSSS